jgi:hypothetical protein
MATFTPTPGEVHLTSQVLAHADAKDGILRGDAALRIFAGSKLSQAVLGQIWGIADDKNNGWLSRKDTTVALRLMGHAQKGTKVTSALISKRNSSLSSSSKFRTRLILACSRSVGYHRRYLSHSLPTYGHIYGKSSVNYQSASSLDASR